MTKQKAEVYLVTGTGRSGTSSVARVLHEKMGVSMGSRFLPASDKNPGGAFEDQDFARFNRALCHGHISFPDFIEKVRPIIAARETTGKPWGVKDPYLCWLIGIYRGLIEDPRIIRCARKPELVIDSLKRTYGYSQKEAKKMWWTREKLLDNALDAVDHLALRFEEARTPDAEIELAITRKWNPINLYVAILNRGTLRREMFTILNRMKKTPGVKVTIENFSFTWGEPICSNRAAITRRFLKYKPHQDFMLQIDDDVVPFHNPAELVHADKDVIGSPAKVRQPGRSLNWVAYREREEPQGYVAVDFGEFPAESDLMEVAVVGTGCILVKREVVEGLTAPFLVEFDEAGVSKYGTDFAFCRKARAAGYTIYTTGLNRVCEHVKQVGLLDIQGFDDSDYRNPAPWKYKMPWGDMAINQKDWEFIEPILEGVNPRKVLEFGAGLSSLLMSEKYKVISYEMNEKYADEIRSKVNGNKLEIRPWDGMNINRLGHYEFAFIDGPAGQGAGGPGRQHSIRLAAKHADKIILHDAGREDEIRWQNAYLRKGFDLVGRNGPHLQRCSYWVRKTA